MPSHAPTRPFPFLFQRFVRGFHARPAAAAERRRTAERVRAERKFDNTVAKVMTTLSVR